jgi:hypothetical protein
MKVKLGLSSEAKDLNTRIPTEYHQFLDIFGEQMEDVMLPHRIFDYAIDMNDGTDPT